MRICHRLTEMISKDCTLIGSASLYRRARALFDGVEQNVDKHIGCDEDEQDADDQTIKTGGFRDGTTQNHGRSYVAFALGLATDGFAGFGGSVAFTDTRADTCNQGKAGANAAAGKDVANSIWLWSPGYRPKMQTLAEQFPQIKTGSVISAVDLIKGIGVYAGLDPIEVEGATGLYDTNYEGKARAAIEALKKQDFVFLHLEASDEAGHDGDPDLKVTTIRYLNDRIVRPVLEAVRTMDEDVSIAVLPDHPTPCAIRTHTAKPVPFTIYRTNGTGDGVTQFDEFSAKAGSYGLISGRQFIELFLAGE